MTQTITLEGFPEPVRKRNRKTGKMQSRITNLSPNSRAHWHVVAAEKKAVKERVGDHVLVRRLQPMKPPVELTAHYVVPDNHPRDMDNYTAILKSVIDGLVASKVLSKDDSRHLRLVVEMEVIPGQRRLILTLRSLASAETV